MTIAESILQKYDGVDWINLPHDGNMWRAIMNTALYFGMQKKHNFLASWIMIILTRDPPLCVNDINKWIEYQSQHNCTFIRHSNWATLIDLK
jgi:hypothetical protein